MNPFTYLVKTACLTLLVMVIATLSVAAAVVPVYATSLPAAAKATFPGTLTLRDGKVTAQLNAVPLGQVMAEVSRLSGVQVVWLEDASRVRPVSVGFTDLPLLRALDRLLGETNFVLSYAGVQRNPRLTHIWIAARRQRTDPLPIASLPASFLTGTTFTGNEPIDALIQTALYAPDATTRARIVAQLGLRDQEDERVRSILSLMAFDDSDPTVRNVAAEMFYSLGNQVETEDADGGEGVEEIEEVEEEG
jgi:hypothetical protein